MKNLLHVRSSAVLRCTFNVLLYKAYVTRRAIPTENWAHAELSKLKQNPTLLDLFNKISISGGP